MTVVGNFSEDDVLDTEGVTLVSKKEDSTTKSRDMRSRRDLLDTRSESVETQ